jgi:hypothetical protein
LHKVGSKIEIPTFDVDGVDEEHVEAHLENLRKQKLNWKTYINRDWLRNHTTTIHHMGIFQGK